jgi:hypothetical protein
VANLAPLIDRKESLSCRDIRIRAKVEILRASSSDALRMTSAPRKISEGFM